jgi:hypothetical protein
MQGVINLDKALCGYNAEGRAYVPYEGNLTAIKYDRAREALECAGYNVGWKCSNVRIEKCGDMFKYVEDGASGLNPKIEVFYLSGDKNAYHKGLSDGK